MFKSLLLTCCTFLLLVSADSALAQAVDEHYEVKVDSNIVINVDVGPQKLDALTEFQYRINRNGNTRQLIIDAAAVSASLNGNRLMNARINKDKFEDSANGNVFSPGDGEDQAKALSTFSVPILEFVVDENGQETSSQLLVENDSDLLVSTGDYRHARMFHPPFVDGQKQWTAPVEFSIGEGGFINGDVRYELVSDEGDHATVQFEGVLSGETTRRGIECKDIQYQLEGSQVYDRSDGKWVSGNLHVDLQFGMYQLSTRVGTAEGTMDFEFAARDIDD